MGQNEKHIFCICAICAICIYANSGSGLGMDKMKNICFAFVQFMQFTFMQTEVQANFGTKWKAHFLHLFNLCNLHLWKLSFRVTLGQIIFVFCTFAISVNYIYANSGSGLLWDKMENICFAFVQFMYFTFMQTQVQAPLQWKFIDII